MINKYDFCFEKTSGRMAVHIFSVRDTMIPSGLCFAFIDIERKHSRFKQLVKFYEKNIIDLEGKSYTESEQ